MCAGDNGKIDFKCFAVIGLSTAIEAVQSGILHSLWKTHQGKLLVIVPYQHAIYMFWKAFFFYKWNGYYVYTDPVWYKNFDLRIALLLILVEKFGWMCVCVFVSMEAKAASDVIVNSLPKGIFALDICAGILAAFCKQFIKTNICFRYLYWHLRRFL